MTHKPAARRVRRWFWAMFAVAVLAMGAVYWAVGAQAGPLAALVLLVGGSVLVLSLVQAARLLGALRGPLQLDVRALYDAVAALPASSAPRDVRPCPDSPRPVTVDVAAPDGPRPWRRHSG